MNMNMLMTKVDASQLTGSALDWAVAKALGYNIFMANHDSGDHRWPGNGHIAALTAQHSVIIVGTTSYITIEGPDAVEAWQPTVKWCQCGPLITRYLIEISHELVGQDKSVWYGYNVLLDGWYSADTPQEAVCIAAVISELGRNVDVPIELLEKKH